MKINQLIRNIALLFFIVFNVYIFYYVKSVEDNKECNCNDNSWEKRYLKFFSILIALIAFVNMFVPINRWLSKIIIIGSAFVLAIVILMALQVYALVTYFKKMNKEECDKCVTGFNQTITDYMLSIGTPI